MTLVEIFWCFVGGIGGGLIACFIWSLYRKTAKPAWIKDVVKAKTDTQWALLREHIENLQAKGIEQVAKLRQAQQVIRYLTDDMGGTQLPVAEQDEIVRALDYFIDGDRFDPNFLPWPRP